MFQLIIKRIKDSIAKAIIINFVILACLSLSSLTIIEKINSAPINIKNNFIIINLKS